MMKHFNPTATITQKIASYGTAVTVGVFIGAALTTGMAFGVAGWWATSRMNILSFLRTAAGHAKSAVEETGLLGPGKRGSGSGGAMTSADQEVLRTVVKQMEALQERLASLEDGSRSAASNVKNTKAPSGQGERYVPPNVDPDGADGWASLAA